MSDQQRALHALDCALTSPDTDIVRAASAVLAARLTEEQRRMIAVIALASLPPDDAAEIAEQVIGAMGMPLPTLLDAADEATWWASLATSHEKRAVLTAAFQALPAKERAQFAAFARQSA